MKTTTLRIAILVLIFGILVLARTLESKLQKGLYFAGEILDVQGPRGGYNLAWAWASGFIAGLTE